MPVEHEEGGLAGKELSYCTWKLREHRTAPERVEAALRAQHSQYISALPQCQDHGSKRQLSACLRLLQNVLPEAPALLVLCAAPGTPCVARFAVPPAHLLLLGAHSGTYRQALAANRRPARAADIAA